MTRADDGCRAACERRSKDRAMTCHAADEGSVAWRRAASAVTIAFVVDAVTCAWSARRERLWLGLVAIPLALTATGLVDAWSTWPALLLCAWACTPTWRWLWVLSLELGFIGVTWAAIGVAALAHFANNRLLVGAIWTAFPLALAGAGVRNRRGHGRTEASPALH